MVVVQVVQTTFVEVIAQVVMILRVHALAQNKPIVFGLSALAVVQFGVGLYLSVASHHGLEFSASGSLLSKLNIHFLQQ